MTYRTQLHHVPELWLPLPRVHQGARLRAAKPKSQEGMKRDAVVVLVAMLALMMAGCGDDRPCLHSHTEEQTYFIMVGKVMVPMIQTVTVCDRYGAKP